MSQFANLDDEKPPFRDDYDDDYETEEDEWEFDCGQDSSGSCSLAGSEECDFECPYRDEMYRKLAKLGNR